MANFFRWGWQDQFVFLETVSNYADVGGILSVLIKVGKTLETLKFPDHFLNVFQVGHWFPSGLLLGVAFPLDSVKSFFALLLFLKDFLNSVIIFLR